MHLVPSTDGVQLAVHDLGGHSPDLLLAHATGFHGLVWRPLSISLIDCYHAVSFDFRAHGDSTSPGNGDFSWDGYREDVLAVVDGLALDRPFGVGHSMGGTTLLMAEMARPGTFRALALYEPVLFPPERPRFEGGNPLVVPTRRRRAEFGSRDEAYDNFAGKPPMATITPAALRAYVDHGFADTDAGTVRLKCEPEHEALTYEEGEEQKVWVRLSEVRCPVLIMSGVVEEMRPSHFAADAADAVANGEYRLFADLGHFGPLEQPEEVGEAIAEFFGRVAD